VLFQRDVATEKVQTPRLLLKPIAPMNKEFGLLDEALGWALHVNDGGWVTLPIEGDDGTRLSKTKIAVVLTHPEAHDREPKPHR
jgi:hypothetical protein